MRVPRVYQPGPLLGGARVALAPGTCHHLTRVLRLRAGARLRLFDGAGNEFDAQLLDAPRRGEALVEIGERVASATESGLEIHLLQGVSRAERMDYTLQKAVELGVNSITPVFTQHCVVSLSDARATQRLQHWQGIVVGACEQCGRNRIPALSPPLPLAQCLSDPARGLTLVLDPNGSMGLRSLGHSPTAVTLLVGPEGGLSATELAAAATAGFQPLRLGPRILRTETAGLAAITALQVYWGDMG